MLNKHHNLLSAYDVMYAVTFINQVDEESLRSHVKDLLYGPDAVDTRLRRFLEWGKVESLPGESKKKGFNLSAASYLLSMKDPRSYPFCKPRVYNRSAAALIGEEAKKADPVEKWTNCREFYSKILALLEKDYGLVNGNLLDVHSLMYLFTSMEEKEQPPEKEKSKNKPSLKPPSYAHPLYEPLLDKHNVVLYGPPGTGKTRLALQLAQWWKANFGQDTVQQVTFHPSYCYEDFIEGFRPKSDGSGFELKEGLFKRICHEAAANQEKKILLIIDEINRGDVARILGEVITLLEGDKRGQTYSTLLPVSKTAFWVPENLYVLGTMNTADKSVSLMDLAIRRRFLFYPLRPDPDVLDEDRELYQEIQGIQLSQLLIGINQQLMNVGIDRDRVLGHSYFIIPKEKKQPLEILKKRFRYEIYPLIEEYCYSDRSLILNVLGQMVDELGMLDDDVFEEDQNFIDHLRALSELK